MMTAESTKEAATPATKRSFWAWAIATAAGAGLIGPAPGTVGSAVGVAVWWLVARYAHGVDPRVLLGGMVVAVTAIGIPAATRVARETGKTDPGIVVIDEVAGQWVTLMGAPLGWKVLLAGFILFRAFDILKPPPVRSLERLPDGWGIVLDDLGAGIYGLVIVQLLLHFRMLA